MQTGSSQRWWDWCLTSEDAVFHWIRPSRSSAAVAELLGAYAGTVMTDGYAAYETLARAGPGQFKQAHCWAHARRKYIEIETFYPEESKQVLDLIGELYRIEKGAPDDPASMAAARDTQSREVVSQIREWACQQRSTPRSGLREAIDYMLKLWPGLTRFLDDPGVPLDNNATERALRPVVLGRKNHFGSRSQKGTEVAAVYYSLLDTAQLRGRDPKDYLLDAARAAINEPGAVILP
jgi:transposase